MNRPLLVLDWGFITMNRLFSLTGKSIPRTRPTEISETIYRISRLVYQLTCKFKPAGVIIAIDSHSGYWRDDYLTRWYAEHTECYDWDGHKIIHLDSAYFAYNQNHKLLKKIAKSNVPSDIFPCQLPEEILAAIPGYKSNRKKQTWVFEISKQAAYAAFDKMAYHLQGCIDLPLAKAIQVPLAEADDIAGVIASSYSKPVIFVSGDSDWEQLKIKRNHVQVYNLQPRADGQGIKGFVDASDSELTRSLIKKIISGDPGDGIPGCGALNRYGRIGSGIAEKIVSGEKSFDIEVEPHSFERNKKLIQLRKSSIPPTLQKAIKKELQAKPKKDPNAKWTDFYIHQNELDIIEMSSIFSVDYTYTPKGIQPGEI